MIDLLNMKMSFLEKVKVCFGNIFIKFPKLKTTEMIDKGNKDTHTSPSKLCSALEKHIYVFAVGKLQLHLLVSHL